jgi:hypothetical protein
MVDPSSGRFGAALSARGRAHRREPGNDAPGREAARSGATRPRRALRLAMSKAGENAPQGVRHGSPPRRSSDFKPPIVAASHAACG